MAMKLARDIQSLSTFKRDTAKLMRQMKKTKEPLVLTVNGRAALVVQDAEGSQALLDAKERMETIEGIRRGLESVKAKRGKPADKFFAEFFAWNDIAEEP
jgi:prevent-host-death family protein